MVPLTVNISIFDESALTALEMKVIADRTAKERIKENRSPVLNIGYRIIQL